MAKLLRADATTERIDRYDLVAEIASGGMATVYLARLSGMGGFQRNVALKLLHPHLAKNNEFVEMFFDEARLAARIHHPNVVPILEVGEGAPGYYLVMEYIEGDTLASLLQRANAAGSQVPQAVVLRLVVDLLSGLHAAHELTDDRGRALGLVHRDVSPQNVLVGADGVTRITDFGVARAASRLSATRVGQLKGKLAYMAPEQINGEDDVDRRADIFSAGVVLWEALTQKRLFKAANEPATISRVLGEEIASPRAFNVGVSEGVAAVCLKALERDRDRRYVSCAEFGDALEQAALQSKALAGARDVAGYVAESLGDELESQRRAIRDWLDQRELEQRETSQGERVSSDLLGASDVGHSGVATRTLVATGQAPRRGIKLALAGALAVLAGLAVSWALGGSSGPHPTNGSTAGSTRVSVTPTPAPSAKPTPNEPGRPEQAGAATQAASAASTAPQLPDERPAGSAQPAPAEPPKAQKVRPGSKPEKGGARPNRSLPSKRPRWPSADLENPYQ